MLELINKHFILLFNKGTFNFNLIDVVLFLTNFNFSVFIILFLLISI